MYQKRKITLLSYTSCYVINLSEYLIINSITNSPFYL